MKGSTIKMEERRKRKLLAQYNQASTKNLFYQINYLIIWLLLKKFLAENKDHYLAITLI